MFFLGRWSGRGGNTPCRTQGLVVKRKKQKKEVHGVARTIEYLTCALSRADGFRNRAGTRERSSRICRSLGELVLFAWSPRLSNVLILHVHAHNTHEQSKHTSACSVLLSFYKILELPLPLKLRFTQYHTHTYESPTLTHSPRHKTHSRTHYKIWVACFNEAQVDSSISTATHASCPTHQHIANRKRVARISRANF